MALLSVMLPLSLKAMTLPSSQQPLDISLTFLRSPGPGSWACPLLFPLSRATLSLTSHLLSLPKQPHVSTLGLQVFFRAATSTCYPAQLALSPPASHKNMQQDLPPTPPGVGICFAQCCVCPQGLVPSGLSRPVNQAREEKDPL